MKVLIADDDVVTRQMLEVLLGNWGYEVISVENGNQAWNILQAADPPRLILMDWMMPGMDGIQVCRKIRSSSLSKHTYIILLTSKDHKDDIVDGLEAGADDYVTKPFDPAELRVRVKAGKRIVELVAKQHRALKSQIDLRNRIDKLLLSIPSGLIIIDAETFKIVDANPMALLMIGLPLEQIVGRDCHNFFYGKDTTVCPLRRIGESVDKRESQLINARGERLPIQKSAVSVVIQGKKYYIENFIDISEHKFAEKERVHKEKLHGVLELAGAVCHELNQPMQVVSGHTEIILAKIEADDPLYERIKTIKGQIERMGKTTHNLMNITRYETKKYQKREIIDIDKASDREVEGDRLKV